MPAGDGRFARRLLAPVHALAVLLKSHPLTRRTRIEVKELGKEPLLLMQREYGSRAWFDAACEMAQVKPRVLMECTTAHTLTELAAVGYGIAVVPSTSLIRNSRLSAIPVVHRGASIGQWSTICWDPRQSLPSYGQTDLRRINDCTPAAHFRVANTFGAHHPCPNRKCRSIERRADVRFGAPKRT